MERSPRCPAGIVLAAALLLPLAASAQYVPPVPPPTCVENCEGAPQDESPPEPPRCRDMTVRFVCGTEEKCDDLGPKGIVCVEVEKWCERTETICG